MNSNEIVVDSQSPTISFEDLERKASQSDESDPELLAFFEEEAADEFKKIESLLHSWHASNVDPPAERLAVAFHTLKGAANSIGQLRIGALSSGIKSVLEALSPGHVQSLREEITKACVISLEAIKALLREARSPKYDKANTKLISAAFRSILDLREKALGKNSTEIMTT